MTLRTETMRSIATARLFLLGVLCATHGVQASLLRGADTTADQHAQDSVAKLPVVLWHGEGRCTHGLD